MSIEAWLPHGHRGGSGFLDNLGLLLRAIRGTRQALHQRVSDSRHVPERHAPARISGEICLDQAPVG